MPNYLPKNQYLNMIALHCEFNYAERQTLSTEKTRDFMKLYAAVLLISVLAGCGRSPELSGIWRADPGSSEGDG